MNRNTIDETYIMHKNQPMRKSFMIGILFILTSCTMAPPYIQGKVEGNVYENDFMRLKIPNDWKTHRSGSHNILTLQKQIRKNGEFAFPTIILDAGTITNNSFTTYFDNTVELVEGSHDRFLKNNIYSTKDQIDSTVVNDIKMYSFETKIMNQKFSIPDLIQTHYYFQIDTVFFHLSVSDYDRFDELKADYQFLIESIKKK